MVNTHLSLEIELVIPFYLTSLVRCLLDTYQSTSNNSVFIPHCLQIYDSSGLSWYKNVYIYSYQNSKSFLDFSSPYPQLSPSPLPKYNSNLSVILTMLLQQHLWVHTQPLSVTVSSYSSISEFILSHYLVHAAWDSQRKYSYLWLWRRFLGRKVFLPFNHLYSFEVLITKKYTYRTREENTSLIPYVPSPLNW